MSLQEEIWDQEQKEIHETIAQRTPTCTFCQREAFAGNYLQPSMCEQHYSIAIMISLLRTYDLDTNYLTVLSEFFFPKLELTPYELLTTAKDMMHA